MKTFAALTLISGTAAAAAAPSPGNLLSPAHLMKRSINSCNLNFNSISPSTTCYEVVDGSDFPGCTSQCGSTNTAINCLHKLTAKQRFNGTGAATLQSSSMYSYYNGDKLTVTPPSNCKAALCSVLSEYSACFSCMLHQVRTNGLVEQQVATFNQVAMPEWEKQCKAAGKEVGAWERVTTSAAAGTRISALLVATVAVAVGALLCI